MDKFFNSKINHFENTTTLSSHSLKCAWCNSIVSPNKGYKVSSSGNIVGYVYICPNCNEVVLYKCYNQTVFPQAKFGNNFSNLPEDINKIYEECRDCYSVSAYTSVLLLARKLLMHIAVDCGAEENKKFIEYVNYLDEKHYIPPNSRNLLNFIREQGNEPNHQIVLKTKEDAEKILNFLSIILCFVYEFADTNNT